ncbi:MAG: right-handed parallel beta-helix repeat-containing protein [Paludibacteraceae bacterium]|nr:right-handed parallel beta-helix repeat-containing protein [Paludibacteraceae bacterium]
MKRIFSLILALMAVQMMWAAKIPVTNTSDDEDEEGSLRWACKNATAEDTIVFKFSTKGDKTIHISSPLSTTASIDGSTWADSIIIEGTNKKANSNDDGFQGVGAFVKNIIVQNCYAGFHVLTRTHEILFDNCIARDCQMGFYCDNYGDVSILHCRSLNNNNCGISSGSTVLKAIEDCHIIGNKKAGIYGQAKNITGCRIYNNDVGIDVVYNSDLIDDCVISGNTTYGIHVSGKVKKSLIMLLD